MLNDTNLPQSSGVDQDTYQVNRKAKISNCYKQVHSSSIPDQEHPIGKLQLHQKHKLNESQEFRPFTTGDHKTVSDRHDKASITKISMNQSYRY